MRYWEVVLSNLKCIKSSSGGGNDELAIMFRVKGQTRADVDEQVFGGFIVEDSEDGMVLTGEHLTGELIAEEGVFALSFFEVSSGPIRGLALSPYKGFRDHIVIESIGLEIDGMGSTLSQGNDYMSQFPTGSIDLGNENVLWHQTWRSVFQNPDRAITFPLFHFLDNQTVLENEDVMESFGPDAGSGWVGDSENRHLNQVIRLHNRDQHSEYHLTISYKELPDTWVT